MSILCFRSQFDACCRLPTASSHRCISPQWASTERRRTFPLVLQPPKAQGPRPSRLPLAHSLAFPNATSIHRPFPSHFLRFPALLALSLPFASPFSPFICRVPHQVLLPRFLRSRVHPTGHAHILRGLQPENWCPGGFTTRDTPRHLPQCPLHSLHKHHARCIRWPPPSRTRRSTNCTRRTSFR